MSVRIRLKRIGRRHRPCYRLTVVDGRRPLNSKVIEELGRYDPIEPIQDRQLELNQDRIEYWLGVGATPSDTVRRLLTRGGMTVKT